MVDLIEHYQTLILQGKIEADPLQEAALSVFQNFLKIYQEPLHSFRWLRSKKPIPGIYIWGSVGIGKTWLMDLFYQQLPTERKIRQHFHVFMRQVHLRLKALQGHSDPLKLIAHEWAEKVDVICFDEFFVNDITDAMLLRGLFLALFKEKVSLVATSNVPPEQLYRNGLQRELFLPAIALIQEHCQVYHLASHQDYRVRTLENAGVYWSPLNAEQEQGFYQLFQKLLGSEPMQEQPILVEGREIANWGHSDAMAGFDFTVLCHEPRSQRDYLVLAEQFPTIFLRALPQMKETEHNKIMYLIQLIDIFYDAGVKLVLSAEVPVRELYLAGPMVFEFERTASRLFEMQTHEYLAKS